MEVVISIEKKRGCGYRSPGAGGVGFYFMGEGTFEACERLPFPLHACLCCGAGIKPARGFTWIEPASLFAVDQEPRCTEVYNEGPPDQEHIHETCWMCNPTLAGARAGLIWIGEKHYKTAAAFSLEASKMGISRKLPSIPNGFEFGKTLIYIAHKNGAPKLLEEGGIEWSPGVFMVYRPSHIDLVIDDPLHVPDTAINLAEELGPDKCRIVKVIADDSEDDESLGFEDF